MFSTSKYDESDPNLLRIPQSYTSQVCVRGTLKRKRIREESDTDEERSRVLHSSISLRAQYTSCKSGKLLRVKSNVCDVMAALRLASEAYKSIRAHSTIIHREINSEISLKVDMEAMHTLVVDLIPSGPSRNLNLKCLARVRAWLFLSGTLLRNPLTEQQTYADDLESFLHVATYVCMLYTPSSYDMFRLGIFFERFYEENVRALKPRLILSGGRMKSGELGGGSYISDDLKFSERPKLADLLRNMSRLFRAIYLPEDLIGDDEREQSSEMYNWADGGMKMHAMFKQALDVVDAWPTTDRPMRMKVYTANAYRHYYYYGAADTTTTAATESGKDC